MSKAPDFADSLASLFTDFVSTLTNASLNLDPLSESRLRSMNGRCIHLVARLPTPLDDKTLSVLVTDGRLEVVAFAAPQPDAVARGSISDLLAWLTSGTTAAGRVSVEGDETVVTELREIFRRYDPVLAETVLGFLDSEVTASILNFVEGTVATLRSTLEGAGAALQRGSAERYLTRPQLESFVDVLGNAQSRVDRLAQRVRDEESRAASSEPDALGT